jgi:hypothetical protein
MIAVMADDAHPASLDDTPEAAQYIIRVQGYLDARWSADFAGLQVARTEDGETTLSGMVADQAALHGILARIRDLNLILVAVNRIEL